MGSPSHLLPPLQLRWVLIGYAAHFVVEFCVSLLPSFCLGGCVLVEASTIGMPLPPDSATLRMSRGSLDCCTGLATGPSLLVIGLHSIRSMWRKGPAIGIQQPTSLRRERSTSSTVQTPDSTRLKASRYMAYRRGGDEAADVAAQQRRLFSQLRSHGHYLFAYLGLSAAGDNLHERVMCAGSAQWIPTNR